MRIVLLLILHDKYKMPISYEYSLHTGYGKLPVDEVCSINTHLRFSLPFNPVGNTRAPVKRK